MIHLMTIQWHPVLLKLIHYRLHQNHMVQNLPLELTDITNDIDTRTNTPTPTNKGNSDELTRCYATNSHNPSLFYHIARISYCVYPNLNWAMIKDWHCLLHSCLSTVSKYISTIILAKWIWLLHMFAYFFICTQTFNTVSFKFQILRLSKVNLFSVLIFWPIFRSWLLM